MITAVFPGSFDPPTYGHLNIIERARTIFGRLHVVVAINKGKHCLFSSEERVQMLEELTSQWDNVRVSTWDTLIVDYAKGHEASVLVRGVRNIGDFSYEFDLALLNRGLDSKVETVFIPTDPKYFVLSSSSIKELAHFGGDISTMVPPLVAEALAKKFS
ncbi:MAG: pantetheine-phosphate adenylyltransferase [Spirochaetaceae bacterium]|nr:pantetheine-phosphate adenylyltransferase [Spirochaetaceae bacterium]MBQ7367667.1 pantetheine-phosphate adenylyltransferase [Spirochaetaceae bacterium]MBR2362545.1 pantetheine-phosphate adenylyltransferase [Spirochaetaceae bacterium]MBR2462768.1 pantetheine-phosphate adenylyltransferase [Spirochaetaceae bacterium]